LEDAGIIGNARLVRLHYRLFGKKGEMHRGTYKVSASQSGDEVLNHLLHSDPIRQMVLVREGLWVNEVAATMAAKEVAPQKDILE
jgi:cell division protein YceG involved in septum cleavage